MKITQNYIDKCNFASKILIESNVKFFPLNPLVIAKHYNILVVSYEWFEKQGLGTEKNCLEISKDGFCFYDNNKYFIVYNDKVSNKGRRRFTITHELAHILLGHINRNNSTLAYNDTYLRKQIELEADMLAICLLAPLYIAHMCDVSTAKEMQSIFGLSKEASENIFKDYIILRHNRELSKIINNDLCCNFIPFISEVFYKKAFYRKNSNTYH